MKNRWMRVFIPLILLTLSGCQRQQDSNPSAQPPPTELQQGAALLSADSAAPQKTLLSETWDVYYLKETKVGYAHIKTSTIHESGRALTQINSQSVISIKRFTQTTSQQLSFSSVETIEGELIRLQSKIEAGAGNVTTIGSVQDGTLNLEVSSLGNKQSSSIPWKKSWGGFFAVEQSLRRKPMKPGETRTVRAFMPIINQAVDTRLKALDYETTALLSGERELLKIKSAMEIHGTSIETIVWTDSQGETLKTLQTALNQTSYRTTEEIALQPSEGGEFDLGLTSVVSVKKPAMNPHNANRVVYRARLLRKNPKDVFVSCSSQIVQSIDEQTARIEVLRVRPDQPSSLENADEQPTDDDLASNNLIQSDDPLIVKMAASVVPDEENAWKVAVAMERYVRETIKVKNFSQAFATAADVARKPEGDCTEHAVLLAALCRARKIPARVAIGLVYYPTPPKYGFPYHMWTEVWIEDRWIALDGTRGQGGIGAGHLKLTHSNLKGASAYTVFLPVIQVLGQLDLEIVQAQ